MSESTLTPYTAPRDLNELVKESPFRLRLLLQVLGGLTREIDKMAWHDMKTPEARALHVLGFLQRWDAQTARPVSLARATSTGEHKMKITVGGVVVELALDTNQEELDRRFAELVAIRIREAAALEAYAKLNAEVSRQRMRYQVLSNALGNACGTLSHDDLVRYAGDLHRRYQRTRK